MKLNRKHPDRGYLYERTERDLCERALAERWEQTCKGDSVSVSMIIGEHATGRDRYVAASLIQWLGTAVGWHWLLSAMKDAGYAIIGDTAVRPMAVTEDPLLRAIHQVELDVQWQDRHSKLAAKAAQLIFDMSEPN